MTFSKPDIRRTPVPVLVPLSQMRSQPLFHVPLQMGQTVAAVAIMKIVHPTAQCHVDLFNYPIQRQRCPPPVGQTGYAALDFLQGLSGWLHMGVRHARFPGLIGVRG